MAFCQFGAIPLSILGAMSFVPLPKEWVTRVIGAAILVFVALKYFGLLKIKTGCAVLMGGGGVVGFLAALMGVAMVLGTWLAKRFIKRMPREAFQRFVAILLVAIAGCMLLHG